MMRGFDSIESMNADNELLVKRRRGSKRFVVGAAVIGGLFFLVGILIGYFSHSRDSTSPPEPQPERLNPTQFLLQNVNTSYLQNRLREFTAQPRLAGTEGGNELAKKIHSLWSASGLDDVHITSYNILLSFPNDSEPNKVQIVNKTSADVVFSSLAYEPPLPPDKNKSSVMNFNAYSPAGIASGDLVYVNYGTLEDFEYLTKNLSLDLSGKIVIIRYGKIFRGNKVNNAERYNASAVILYTDPADVNKAFNDTGKDKPYPDSWWMPSTGVQRGTLFGGGENPDTPFYPATDYAVHIDPSKRAMPKIPCQPISYEDATNLLRNLNGPVSPASWKGTLPVDYRIGPGYENTTDLKVEVTVNNFLDTRPIHHVIGIIKGREEPDRYVLLGNHHDAWVYGAVDPQSGGVALSHVVDLFGQLLKLDYRPRRTLIFCSWDAEETGLIGSSEWVKDNLKVLYERSVAYLNVDMSAQGNYTLLASVSPLLQDALYDAAKQVPSPISDYKTLYDLWLARPISNDGDPKEPRVSYSLGAGSDHAKFYQLAGVPCTDIRMFFDSKKYPLSSYPLYHSSYDNSFSYENYQDPGFVYTKALTQFWAVLANNLADSSILPLNVQRYSAAVSKFINDLLNIYRDVWTKNHVNIDALVSAVDNFTVATEYFQSALSAEQDLDKKPYRLRMYNDKMIQLERAFINSEGLPDRPQMKHIIFAPSNFDFYADTFFPGISDTMYNINKGLDQWDRLKQQVYIATFFIQSASRLLYDIGL
uniref:Aminopeptidase NAALADL1 n=1 Tax=Arion vulgaris TaxID=1028688 RepID=A0A0B7B352_9EUPU